MSNKRTPRREFLRKAATTTLAVSAVPTILSAHNDNAILKRRVTPRRNVAPADKIRLATIGMGIIGFIDTDTALLVPGTELVAAADCYTGRLDRTKEIYGSHVDTTRDYRDILARDDIDAVIVATPDHWHADIAIAAMEAGKAVYCEKPMVQKIEDGPRVIEAQGRTDTVFQVGSQYASHLLYHKARELYLSGEIGELNMVEARYNRNSAIGAWQYSIPPDASPETIDWDMFLGKAPRLDFDPLRFFRWRNYQDYGTGMAGDLFVHLFTGIHLVTGALGPTEVVAQGGLRFWNDGRDVPDVMLALFNYPETENHPSFTLSLQCNFADGSGGGSEFRFIGSEGVITMDWDQITLNRAPRRRPSEEAVVEGYNSVRTFSEATQKEFVKAFRAKYPTPEPATLSQSQAFRVPNGYDSRLDHFMYFFESIRDGKPVFEDAAYGYRAAAPSLLANMSYWNNQIYQWDPQGMKMHS